MTNYRENNKIADTKLGTLPRWDLKDLYPSEDSPQLQADLASAKQQVDHIVSQYQGKLAKCTGGELAQAISAHEEVSEKVSKIGSYAFLLYATSIDNQSIAAFFQDVQEKITELTTPLVFFTLEINRIDDSQLNKMLQDPALAYYKPWLRDIGVYKPYQLSDAEETILYEKSLTSTVAWNRLFDETLSALRFPFQDSKLGCSEIFEKLSSSKAEVRKEAALSISQVLQENGRLFALITNTLAKDKALNDTRRGFDEPISSRNLANFIEDEVVDVLLDTVRKNYSQLSHRYYKIKAKMMGKEQLDYWERNAPLEEVDEVIPWDKAVETVLAAYGQFSPEMEALGRQFFDNNWIDAPMEPSKRTGAFAHPTVPSVHPYLMLNYSGRINDVMTLAHELGHGVHMLLAAKQGPLMSDTPLTLAETASVFGEQLTFRYMLSQQSDPKKKQLMIAKKVEDMLNTVVRQVAFCDFEIKVHAERAKGELSMERIGQIWMEVSHQSLGEGIRLDDGYSHYWSYISHFIHAPFYVYAYAFGDCLVNSLYKVYLDGEVPDFQQRYFEMLGAGGTLWHKELLEPFGLDATDTDFWQQGLDVISSFIDDLY